MRIYHCGTSRWYYVAERPGTCKSLFSVIRRPVSIHVGTNRWVGGVQKELVYNYIKQAALPFTIIDVGWWYQLAFPRLSSGKIDYALIVPNNEIIGDGNTPNALTDLRDIGRYVARIIVDDRTLNKMVFTYNTVLSPNEIYDLLERISGEKIERKYVRRPSNFAV